MHPADQCKILGLEELLDDDALDDWEESFVRSLVAIMNYDGELSDKQSDKLDQVWDKHCKEA